jgi:hypothetical protein
MTDFEDVDERELLIGILTQLQYQNRLLADMADADMTDPDDTPTEYECAKCDAVVVETDREPHAKSAHNVHPEMRLDELFSQTS